MLGGHHGGNYIRNDYISIVQGVLTPRIACYRVMDRVRGVRGIVRRRSSSQVVPDDDKKDIELGDVKHQHSTQEDEDADEEEEKQKYL